MLAFDKPMNPSLSKWTFSLHLYECIGIIIYWLQVAKATSVADEALGNIRTVRAFAMEDKESRLAGVCCCHHLVLCILHSYGVLRVYSNSSVMVYICMYMLHGNFKLIQQLRTYIDWWMFKSLEYGSRSSAVCSMRYVFCTWMLQISSILSTLLASVTSSLLWPYSDRQYDSLVMSLLGLLHLWSCLCISSVLSLLWWCNMNGW